MATPTRLQAEAGAGAMPIDQLYVTHCLYDEGLAREAGFGVRASSTRDPLLLRFALEYPPYELPVGLGGDETAAPRRLALVRVPGGRSALIHSVVRPGDERGRANNFFSHLLFGQAIPACDALASWAAAGWAADCPPGADKDIPPLAELPRGGAVGDRALTAFLQATSHATDPVFATRTCPQRLADDRKRRRRLLSLALRGCLLALQAGPATPRGRFFLLAEPGLVALLLYGAARLLPQALAEGMTFSTYENAATALRSSRHAQVVGTWLADPARGLDAEFFSERGYALDTVNDKFSDELAGDADRALEEWVELASRGEWAAVDRLHGLLGKTATTVVAYKEGVQADRLSRRLASGRADVEDLLVLRRAPWGAALLEQHHVAAWPLVRDGCLADPRLREEFADLLREHLPELENRAARALRQHPPGNWQPHWRVLWFLLQGTPARLRETFERVLPEPPLPPALCFSILTELQTLQLTPGDPRVPLHLLLKNFDGEELDEFARSPLPREWFVWALCYALLRPEARAAAARHVHEGSDELVRAFWQQFRLLKEQAQRRAILTPLVATVGDRGPTFLGRLLSSSSGLRPETLSWLLEALGAWKREWAEFWGRDDHLGRLLAWVRDFGEEGGPVWDRFCAEIDRGVLPPGDPYQHTLLMNLVAVKGRPGPPLPGQAAEAIADWAVLRDHFEKASALPGDERRAVIDACNRRHLDPVAELSEYFARFVQPKEVREEFLDDFAGFFHSFYPEPAEYRDHEARLIGWLQVVGACPDAAKKEAYQRYYLERFVPLEFRRRLAEETHRAGKLLPAVYEPAEKPVGETDEAPAPAPVEDVAGPDELHQLSGVRLAEGQATLPILGLWRRLPWLLFTLAGGVLAALLFGLYLPPTPRAAALPPFVPFLPLVLAFADSIALQSVGLAVRLLRQPPVKGAVLRALAKELLGGALLGIVCGAAAGGVVLALDAPQRLSLAVGSAVAAAVAMAALVGFLLPALFGLVRGGRRVAAGPLARAAVGAAALLLYFFLTRVLAP
ncbi:MAG TPA: magnesium transporter [Gemmataceae bacterium]|nr:magnesium transporter [Gemmataceae bacterium]